MLRRSLRSLANISKGSHLMTHRPFSRPMPHGLRGMSSTADGGKETQLSKKLLDEDEYEDYSEAKTTGQKLRWFGIVFTRLGFLIIGSYCVYLTAIELFPGRMSPNHLYNAAFEIVRNNAEVIAMAGDNMKAYGREVGGSAEGRRNHIDQYKYVDEKGSKRTRVRFTVEGSKGKARVWAEVCEASQPGDLAFLICQDTRTGRVHTLVDSRSYLDNRDPPSPSTASSVINSFYGLFPSTGQQKA